jgi:hypothetical protein
MLQLIALLAISWLLIWLFEKRGLSVLGLWPTGRRVQYLLILLLVSAAAAASAVLLQMYIAGETYTISPSLTAQSVLIEIWYQFRTVLTEELLFRGVLLYILIKITGPKKSIFIAAVLFGIIHWTNAGVWGNPTQMFLVFAFTFLMGWLLAFAYARTFSLLIPFAIHFGWNLVQNYVFPGNTTGNHIFAAAMPPPVVTISYLAYYTMLLLPKLLVLVAGYLIVSRYPQAPAP